ncbi:ABC transporter permease [Mycolicibacterium smegmatis]|uniref:ABC transporter permease n=1 Tax=Mycolicibacterium smegmatis TaxID=1772 RepID=UPI0020A461A4|nr:ABC transporter permease [Mycolicibacterium smegmatis]MCP2621307.1 ABC transporter permease [Mycolicibacterium smegmatis]MCP2622937.1 ABC transporter permease [Mycolicibacterium smegmatis]
MTSTAEAMKPSVATPEAELPTRGRRPRLYRELGSRTYTVIAVGSMAVLLVLWWVYARYGGTNPTFLPGPDKVARRFVEYLQGDLLADAAASFNRVTIGFLLSTVMAVPLGVLLGTVRIAEAAVEPTMGFIRYMPAVAFVPLTIIWIGVGEEQKWLVIWIGTFFTQVLMVMDNVKRVRRELINVGYTLGMSDFAVLTRIVIPASSPAIWDTLRITLGWAWTWLVLAEVVAADDGLGHRVTLAQRYLQTDTIFVALIVIGLIGLAMDQVMKIVGRRVFRWAERGNG